MMTAKERRREKIIRLVEELAQYGYGGAKSIELSYQMYKDVYPSTEMTFDEFSDRFRRSGVESIVFPVSKGGDERILIKWFYDNFVSSREQIIARAARRQEAKE